MRVVLLSRRIWLQRSPVAWALLAAAFGGCGGSLTAEQALEKQFQKHPEFKKVTVAKFAGRVAVDGNPPSTGSPLFVILTIPSSRKTPASCRRSLRPAIGKGILRSAYIRAATELPPDRT
jgi:hypothetical protein